MKQTIGFKQNDEAPDHELLFGIASGNEETKTMFAHRDCLSESHDKRKWGYRAIAPASELSFKGETKERIGKRLCHICHTK